MSFKRATAETAPRVFGLHEWVSWLDTMANENFKMSGKEFEDAYVSGRFAGTGIADDLAAVLPIIHRLRERLGTDEPIA